MTNLRGMFAGVIIGLSFSTPAWGYEEMTVTGGGILKGTVRFSGAVPTLPPIAVKKSQELCGSSKPSEALVIGSSNGVRSTVILVEGVRSGKRAERETLIDSYKCAFTPHVAAVMAGGKLTVKNSDDGLHNIRGFLAKAIVFNLALPRQHQEIDLTSKLKRPGAVELLCDAHPHMRGWLVVHDSPYFAVTDQHGNFMIDGIAPGKYKITMWHEPWSERGRDNNGRVLYGEPILMTREVTIQPNGTTTIEFELKSFNSS